MSTHGGAAFALGARLPWQDARGRSPALLRLVKATMAAAVAFCLAQPASAQQHSGAFAVPYTGALKKINDSGEIRVGYRENSPPFAFLDAQKKPEVTRSTSAKSWWKRSRRSSAKTSGSSGGR